jgi:hypothetical protein
MTNRHVAGKLAGGDFGIRTSLPGFDVLAEPFGSAGISFDSRLTDIGTVVAAGLAVCGGSPVFFSAMGYVPIVKILKWDGTWLQNNDNRYKAPAGGQASNHYWYPVIGVVTANSLSIIPYSGPGTFNPLTFFNPNGQYYMYYVFASG